MFHKRASPRKYHQVPRPLRVGPGRLDRWLLPRPPRIHLWLMCLSLWSLWNPVSSLCCCCFVGSLTAMTNHSTLIGMVLKLGSWVWSWGRGEESFSTFGADIFLSLLCLGFSCEGIGRWSLMMRLKSVRTWCLFIWSSGGKGLVWPKCRERWEWKERKNLAKDATSLWILSQNSGSCLLQGKGSQRLCLLRLHTVACMVVWTAETRPEHRGSALLQPRVLCGSKVWGACCAGAPRQPGGVL